MTLQSSGPISIQNIKTEFASRGAYNDLNSWGQVVLGRASGAAVSLSEFYGKSNILSYTAPFPPSRVNNLLDLTFATAHGTFYYAVTSREFGGVNTQRLNLATNVAFGVQPAWLKFIRVEIPWMGMNWTKAIWEANAYDLSWGGGNFAGGNMIFYFNG